MAFTRYFDVNKQGETALWQLVDQLESSQCCLGPIFWGSSDGNNGMLMDYEWKIDSIQWDMNGILMVLIVLMEYYFWETQRWCNNGNIIGIQWDIKGIVMFERWETPCEINMMIYLANLAMVKIHENPILNDQRYKVVPPE